MIDLTSLSREEFLESKTLAGVERLVERIVVHREGKKAYLLAKLIRQKLVKLTETATQAELRYKQLLILLDGTSLPLLSEDEVIALAQKHLSDFLSHGIDVAERVAMVLLDLPVDRREQFKKRFLETVQACGAPGCAEVKQEIDAWEPPEGLLVRRSDGSWNQVGIFPVMAKPAEPPRRVPLSTPKEKIVEAPKPAPAQKKIAPPPTVPLEPLHPAPRPAPKVIPKPAPPSPLPAQPTAPAKQRIHEIRPSKPLMSTMDELRSLDTESLRRHGDDPRAFLAHVEQTIRSYQKGGLPEYAKAIGMWRESPLFRLYQSVARESLQTKKALGEVVAARQASGAPYLTERMMDEVSSLNRRLRLG